MLKHSLKQIRLNNEWKSKRRTSECREEEEEVDGEVEQVDRMQLAKWADRHCLGSGMQSWKAS